MLAFTTIIKQADGKHEIHSDALYRLPPELMDIPSVRSYLRISRPGWSSTEFGYKNYSVAHSNGDLYIFPSLLIADETRPRKRFPGYTQAFSKQDIERYAQQVFQIEGRYHAQVDEQFNMLIHDLRALSASIYHSAEEAMTLLNDGAVGDAKTRVQNIISAQNMLRLRTDALDFAGNPGLDREMSAVPVYRRVDKVVRCFQAIAAKKNIRCWLEGASRSTSFGPNVFEIVPYLLIDNAIKYSPPNSDITIKLEETRSTIVLTFTSIGPLIDPDEMVEIFTKAQRGRHAIKSNVPGTGVGLFLAKSLVEQFRGTISVATSDSQFIIGDRRMTDVIFKVELPIYVEKRASNVRSQFRRW